MNAAERFGLDLLGEFKIDAARSAEGRVIASTPGAIEKLRPDLFSVKSQSGPGSYRVSVAPGRVTCSCPDFLGRGLPCKHAAAVRFHLEEMWGAPSRESVVSPSRTAFSQAWASYDRAQMEEVRLFDVLLADLLSEIEEPVQAVGRPRVPLREGLFCAVQKVYSQLSCRRAHSLSTFAVERGQLPSTHGFVISSRALNRADVTPVLLNLISRSAIPLTGIEHGFAADSTGIRTTSFGAWREEKHGDKRHHVWLKAHALVGTKTHVVAQVSITDPEGGDNPQFEPLIRAAWAAGMKAREVYADKAYLARSNFSLAEELGFDLYVPFRSNSRMWASGRSGKGLGSKRGHALLWKKAFLYFQMHREEFEARYHQRSNVESVFSSLKRKLGETLRSKNRTSQINELLAKVLAYNIMILIHEVFEHGVVPDFLKDPGVIDPPCIESQTPVSEPLES